MNIGIIGLGLIGSSLGAGLKKYNKLKIWGTDINQKHIQYTQKNNIIDETLDSNNIKKMDFIFIAVPVCSIIKVIKKFYPYLNKSKTIITDMGSTKNKINKEINENFPDLKYIGGHPMAGKETSGPETAEANLFKNKSYILIENKNLKNELKELKNLLLSLQCKIKIIDSKTHDQLVAITSHLPQITASLLVDELLSQEKKYREIDDFVGTGFLDLTRIAAANPEMWQDIFCTNKNNIIKEIENIRKKLFNFKQDLQQENFEKINEVMKRTRKKRKNMNNN